MVLIDTLAAGGAERVAVELACALDPAAYAPHVVVTKRGGPLEERLATAAVPYRVLGRKRRSSPGPLSVALRLARRSDLIHSHLFGNNVWGALLARAARVPLVAHEHNRVDRYSRFEGVLDRRLLGPTAKRIVCVSDDAAGSLLAAGVDPGTIEVVPNGVSPRDLLSRAAARAELGLPREGAVIGSVASLRREKALDVLLRAFARLAAPGVQLCVVGDGSEREPLRALARELRIADRVVWAGERPDAAQLFAAFDVSVLSSRSEGLPLAALEAMAAGSPLVASGGGALPEVLRSGGGVLVEPGDDAAFASAIGDLLGDPSRARQLGEQGRAVIAERFLLAPVVGRIERIYDDALRAGRTFGERRNVETEGVSGERREKGAG